MKKSDTALIQAVVAGSADAFGFLVERYQGGTYALVWSVVRDFASAEDITQEAFITAYARLSELRDPEAFPAWLRQIAVNTARMWLRKHRDRETTADLDRITVADDDGRSGLREEVIRILESLPEKKRQVAILCYLDGFSRKNAARLLGVSEVALRKRLHDAKRLLQKRIVEVAEKNLEEHLLPKGFASRCICACKRVDTMTRRRQMKSTDTKRKNCGCGCSWPDEEKSNVKGNNRRKTNAKANKPAKAGG
jgi:RNA polymerase sigma factor (sigma-70 family)